MRYVNVLIILLFFAAAVEAERPEKVEFKEKQYKRVHQKALQLIVDGEVRASMSALDDYGKRHEGDFETAYCMAVGYGKLEQTEKALAKLAPFWTEDSIYKERILIGLNTLLSPIKEAFLAEYPDARGGLEGVLSGPMLGDLQSSSVKVWLRSGSEAMLTVCVQPEAGGDVLGVAVRPNAEEDYTATATLTGLAPETAYRYWVVAGESTGGAVLTEQFTFTTPVAAGQSIRFRATFGGGAGYVPQHEHMWNTIRGVAPDFMLLLGDNVYPDDPERPPLIDYSYYRRQSRTEYRGLIAETPIYAVWDDHDFGINDCLGGPELDVPAWKGPVWQTFKNNWVNPYYGGGEESRAVYFNFVMGDVEFFLLDSRYYRTAPYREESTLLGPIQKAWLKEKLAASEATFKVICTPVPWSHGVKPTGNKDAKRAFSGDTWDGFPNERDEINAFLDRRNIEGVIFLAADRHRSDLWRTDRERAYPQYECMSSRLTNQHVHKEMEKALFSYNKKQSFGMIEVDTTVDDPTFSYAVINIDGEGVYRHTIRRSELNYR